MSLKFFKSLFDSFPWPWQEPNIEQNGVFFSCFLGVIALLWFLWLFINKSKKGLPPLPPGPKALPLIGNLLSLNPELHTYLASLSQTYGPICRLWLGKKFVVIITSPSLAREVLKDQHTIFSNRDMPATASEASYGGQDIVWIPYGPKWRMLRKGLRKKMKVLANRFDKIFESMIDQRQKLDRNEGMGTGIGLGSKDFLQVLLKLKDETDAKMPLSMTELKALLMDMVVAGTDTTSNTVEFAMAEIMNKPDVLRKLQQELEIVVGKDNIVEESHIRQLPYLYAVMKEVLRIHPILPLLVSRCPSETCIVGGYTVPKGSSVLVNVWAIQRDPSIWENPSEFHPERFVDSKWDYSGKDFNYLPFGSGRRMCAGTAMAERMFMYSLASLIHSFDWKLLEGETLDLSEKFGAIMKKKRPLVAVPIPRLSNPTLYE
ncbi:flavonoid 3'-monooxygenase CYP75B137 isoform X2 [Capsicum annuum]|uniref:flavonoid 3'-monooxygenase CYP75B137 isoform X2 n=1 Tax=Capsicum annuum TaxID=4072 RepID=UPI001FB11AEB|nr:flavonoid 3'-monooxygenase CYP75B137 isoform X2 [Capsicum annuum]